MSLNKIRMNILKNGVEVMESNVQIKKARKLIIFMLFLGWALGNLDRYLINYAIVFIGDDLSLTGTQTGIVLSSFFLGYAIMQIPGGLLADKFGAKKVLLGAVIFWSIFTGLTAIAWSLAALVVIRFLFGIGEGGFQPSAAKIISTSFPANERGKAMSILLSSGAIMGMLVPIISAILLVTIGWRMFFAIAGALGIIIAILYVKFIRIPASVEEDIEEGTLEESTSKGPEKGVLRVLVKMPAMWSLILACFTVYSVSWGLNSWLPKYLTDVRGLDILSIGGLQMIPGVVTLVAMFAFGPLIDKLSLQTNKVLGAISAVFLAVFLFLMFGTSSIVLFIVYQSVIAIFMTYIIILLPSFVLKIIPSKYAGTAVGMANTGGQIAGFLTPILIGYMVDVFDGSYNAAVWMLVILASVCVLAIISTKTKKQQGDEQYETI